MRAASLAVLFLSASVSAMTIQEPNVVARALYPRQSGSPGGCIYGICPPTDNLADNLQSSFIFDEGLALNCNYGAVTCEYDTTTSFLVTPNVDCQTSSLMGGCSRRRAAFKREDNYTAMLRRAAARNQEEGAE